MSSVEIYTTSLCGFCFAAKRLLDNKGVSFTEIVQDQLDQKMYLEKAAQKPLQLIQVGFVLNNLVS